MNFLQGSKTHAHIIKHLFIATVFLIGAALCLFNPEQSGAYSLQFEWDPPEEGTPKGYVICYGYESRNDVEYYPKCVKVKSKTMANGKIQGKLTQLKRQGRVYFFAVKAYNKWGESGFSNEEPYPTSGGGINLLKNWNFEYSETNPGWQLTGSAAISAKAAYEGSYGLRIFGDGQARQKFPTYPGRVYNVTAMIRIDKVVKLPKEQEDSGFLIRIPDASDDPIPVCTRIINDSSPIGQWQEMCANFSFTAKGTKTRIIFEKFGKGLLNASVDNFVVTPVSP